MGHKVYIGGTAYTSEPRNFLHRLQRWLRWQFKRGKVWQRNKAGRKRMRQTRTYAGYLRYRAKHGEL